MLLLLDGHRSRSTPCLLVLLVPRFCPVGDYGYATNELYDVEEVLGQGAGTPRRSGRQRAQVITVMSAVVAELLSWVAAGAPGAALTLMGLALPYVYGGCAMAYQGAQMARSSRGRARGPRLPGGARHIGCRQLAPARGSGRARRQRACLVGGRRHTGILSDQLHTAERDRRTGLTTVVHDFGALRIERFIAFILLPVEVASFIGAVVASDGGVVLWVFSGIYLADQAAKTLVGGLVVKALRPEGLVPTFRSLKKASIRRGAQSLIAVGCGCASILRSLLVIPFLLGFRFRPQLRAETLTNPVGARLALVQDALCRLMTLLRSRKSPSFGLVFLSP